MREVGLAALAVLLAVVTFCITAWVWVWAWNLLVPALFGGPHISYMQALALSVVVSMIGSAFKSSTTSKEK